MFSGQSDHAITLDEAKARVRRQREHQSAIRGSDPQCEFFGREVLDRILAQPGCAGIRIYHGRNDKGQHALVLVGTDASGGDQLDGTIAEKGRPCPPYCDAQSTLAS